MLMTIVLAVLSALASEAVKLLIQWIMGRISEKPTLRERQKLRKQLLSILLKHSDVSLKGSHAVVNSIAEAPLEAELKAFYEGIA